MPPAQQCEHDRQGHLLRRQPSRAIINLSLEFEAGTITAADIPQLIQAIAYAHSKNVLVVAAAGNDAIGQISYPAKAPYVLAVGATTIDGCLAEYSNFGANLALVAPAAGTMLRSPATATASRASWRDRTPTSTRRPMPA